MLQYASLLVCLASVSAAKPTRAPAANLTTVLASDAGNFSVITGLLQSTGLLDTLENANAITLFLPTDEAMAKVPQATLDALNADKQMLTDLLSYHAVVGEADRLRGRFNDRVLMSAAGKPVRINTYMFHTITAEGVPISQANIPVANGYINAIDGVMSAPNGNIVDIIASRSDLSTLASLLSSAGLIDVVRADENITVFAPTDAAFAKVDSKIIDFLKANPEALKNTLLFHVVAKTTLYSAGIHHAAVVNTADHNKQIMALEDGNGKVYVNNAEVTEKDISADNGVLHIIDSVMIPTKEFVALQAAGIVN